jgi:hypothetical protein
MTLAAIIAAHSANLPHPKRQGVARCGAQTVGTPSATPATPATPKKQAPALRTQTTSDRVQPAEPLKTERTHLLALAAAEWIDAGHVQRMTDADLADWIAAGLDDGQRRAFLHLLDETARLGAYRKPTRRRCSASTAARSGLNPPLLPCCPWSTAGRVRWAVRGVLSARLEAASRDRPLPAATASTSPRTRSIHRLAWAPATEVTGRITR